MEVMKIILIKSVFYVVISAQEYSVSIFGFHAADVIMSRDSTSSEFQTNNRGIFDLIWPTSNNYKTVFDEDNYSIKVWEKTIRQGSNIVRVSGSVTSDGYMKYKGGGNIKVDNKTQTVFTILEMAIMMDRKYLDTKWFPYEHEGRLGRARLIWADSLNQWSGVDSILCDHYRFDIEITDSTKQVKTSDYFMNNIIRPDCVREIWVSREIPKNIIAAKVSLGSIPVIARIQTVSYTHLTLPTTSSV